MTDQNAYTKRNKIVNILIIIENDVFLFACIFCSDIFLSSYEHSLNQESSQM